MNYPYKSKLINADSFNCIDKSAIVCFKIKDKTTGIVALVDVDNKNGLTISFYNAVYESLIPIDWIVVNKESIDKLVSADSSNNSEFCYSLTMFTLLNTIINVCD